MDGKKMSKSRGNLVAPQGYFDGPGADALRLFHLFVGPPVEAFDWTEQTDEVIEGCRRFLDRLWRLATAPAPTRSGEMRDDDVALRRQLHRTISSVTDDLERWSFNTAVAPLMELQNALTRSVRSDDGAHAEVFGEVLDALCLLLAPMTPHVTAELWHRRHADLAMLHRTAWPVADPELIREATETLVVQVDGKVKDRIEVPADLSEEAATSLALASERVLDALGGAAPSRVVARPPRLVNVVR